MAFLKVFHIFFLFLWLGSLFFLSRLLARIDRVEKRVHEEMIPLLQKIYWTTELPSMCIVIVLGLALFMIKGVSLMKGGWFHMKLTFALLLIVTDILMGRALFKPGRKKSSYFYTLHILALFFFFLILVSIYIIKPLTT
jgi:putative membrane protein